MFVLCDGGKECSTEEGRGQYRGGKGAVHRREGAVQRREGGSTEKGRGQYIGGDLTWPFRRWRTDLISSACVADMGLTWPF